MHDDEQLLGLRDYLDVLRRHRRLVAGLAAVVAFLAAVATSFTTFTFTSSVELLVQAPSGGDLVERAVYGDTGLATQQRIVTSSDVTRRVADELGLPATPETVRELIDAVKVSAAQDSSVLTITAQHDDPELAAAIPSLFAEEFLDYQEELADARISTARAQLESRIEEIQAEVAEVEDELQLARPGPEGQEEDAFEEFLRRREAESQDRALFNRRDALLSELTAAEQELIELELIAGLGTAGRIISPVTVPEQPSLVLLLLRNMALGAILGATLGALLAFVREWSEDAIVRERDIVAITGRPVAGRVRESAAIPYRPDGAAADEYRGLRAAVAVGLRGISGGHPGDGSGDRSPVSSPTRLLVTGVDEDAPAAQVAANLSVAFARSGVRTLLIDVTDRAGRYFAVDGASLGLHALLDGSATAGEAATRPPVDPRLAVLGPGPMTDADHDRVTADRLSDVLAALHGQFDLVLVEAGALTTAPAAAEAAVAVSEVLLVAGWERSTREDIKAATDRAAQLSVRVLGTVLTKGAGRGGEADVSRRPTAGSSDAAAPSAPTSVAAGTGTSA